MSASDERRYPAAPDETVVERDRRNAARAGAEAVYANKRDGRGGGRPDFKMGFPREA